MKKAGILLPIFSLPSDYGIGDFGKSAYDFIDWLKKAGQSYWQILPLTPTSYGDSPYQSPSVFAGNPYFISLDMLKDEGLLSQDDLCIKNEQYIDYKYLFDTRLKILEKAYINSSCHTDFNFVSFCNQNSYWLDDYSLFMAIKEENNNKSWDNWDNSLKTQKNILKENYKNKLDFYKFIQYKFYSQWQKLKEYANKNNIKIIGDIPIYTAYDSADVWANPELFLLNENKEPTFVAGCPPDGFSKDGQLWGNPLYDWNYHKKTNYCWWIKRMKHSFDIYDSVRIDHFRGFSEYYCIAYKEKTAKNGFWEKGPGISLFNALNEELGKKDIIAEDLGFVTDNVKELLRDTEFSGMKVLQFAFDLRDTGSASDYLPHNYTYNSVAYTGTHDNFTLKSWLDNISDAELNNVRDYLCDFFTPTDLLYKSLVRLTLSSNSRLVIIPIQDYLGYDDKARINTPSSIGNNWRWRLDKKDLSDELCKYIYSSTRLYSR